ncbi:histidinol-phosphate transaminase [Cocleimonas sp. KMM 6892]|uniref:histidinol-phosphate transaminase n=1 Tax=unclassified Cocleimonas TaxID=2639732 RepID=UPI002DBCF22B|nr:MULTISPECIES: histidinol-phosphate transaminase [unclassified Cocleimonas]MEB8431631.1 histidinol-phosphate transaminase [Cocleimonas sp. KMM 6892]MEC4713597.1 histidinol-phosphate transaminase [Cocleimonas sp. KMM 6895]MEC4742928.1 histidinol-phosphate transaminase [Cocleimonas sp. KMM 6896]
MSKFWSKRTHELSPYTAGEQPQDQQYTKLNTNENPYPPSPLAIEAMRAASGEAMRLYPDPNSFELKKAISEYYSVWTDQVFVGNSSDEVLAHAFVALLKHSKPLLFPDISYSFYPSYCKLFDINYKQVPLADDFTIDLNDYSEATADEVGSIIFPNPNAPTGIALTLVEIEKILKANPESPVVIDEAYVDFGARTAISLVNDYPNLLVTQTFSKSRSLAGLRVGFAIGSVEMIEALERVKNSFNAYPLDRAAIAGAAASIRDRAYFQESCSRIIKTRERVSDELSDLGFTVLPSKANFVFAKPEKNAEQLYLDLKENGVLVRYFNAPRINGFLRITIGTDEDMDVFMGKLKQLL